jgi:bifunctional DNase/RNase
VDSRPSDAVNLALVTGAPIRVESDVFASARDKEEVWRTYPSLTEELVGTSRHP